MKAPERFATERLLLRKPTLHDAEAIFTRYAGDAEVTKYLAWRRHESIEDTRDFLRWSDAEWGRWPAGPYIIELQSTSTLLGSTGFTFESPSVVFTGYALASDAWGYGYATESLAGIVKIAEGIGVQRMIALCHPENAASIRVLQKCGFGLEERHEKHVEFPNLRPGERQDCLRYVRAIRRFR